MPLRRFRTQRFLNEEESLVEAPPIVSFAAVKAGHGALQFSDPFHDGATAKTFVGVALFQAPRLKVEFMTAILAGDSEIGTGLFPLRPVRLDALSSGAGEGNEVGEFVEEGVLNFKRSLVVGEGLQLRVELDRVVFKKGPPGSGSHPGIPFHLHSLSETGELEAAGEFGGDFGEGFIRAVFGVHRRGGSNRRSFFRLLIPVK